MSLRSQAHATLGVLALLLACAGNAQAQSTFKVAYFNIQSGKGEPGLAGRPILFHDTSNCTDPSQPINAWGVQFVQKHLQHAIGADPSVVALGLSEAWGCGSPSSVRQALRWAAQSTERNGVALLARYGFSGPEEWVQLDTSLNDNPHDTMWVLRVPVCLNAACSAAINVFSAHWFGYVPAAAGYEAWKAVVPQTYDKQAQQTVDFLRRTSGGAAHILIGDLNTWEGSAQPVCEQYPPNTGLNVLRHAGYVDAWPLLHGSSEGFTGMTNRKGCGAPEGYAWKRIDYVWSPAHFLPTRISRFGVVTPGDPAPSDHYGLVAEFPLAGVGPLPTTPAPVGPTTPVAPGEVVLYAADAKVTGPDWQIVADIEAAGGARAWNPDRAAAKLTTPLSAPASFIDLTFTAEAGRPYRMWVRGRADNNSWANDSLFVQFSGSVSASGTPMSRIKSPEAMVVSIEEGSGAGLANWGWQDNAYGAGILGPLVHFAASGSQTVRIQQREDGVSFDQVVLSPAAFLSVAPGATKNDSTMYARATGTPPGPSDVILKPADTSAQFGRWYRTLDGTAAGGARLWNPDAAAAKLADALAQPVDYFDMTFAAVAGVPYRLWIRGRADADHWSNDSTFVQFSGSVSSAGAPVWRIGTTDATRIVLEEDTNRGLSGWGWQDNGFGTGVLGPVVVFATTGAQTIRIQTREDGLSIDQIVLSPQRFFTAAPGAIKDDTTILR